MEEFGAFTGLHWCGWEIRSGEQSLSPSAFSNLKDSEQWILADTCRAQQKALIARLFAGAEPQLAAPLLKTPC